MYKQILIMLGTYYSLTCGRAENIKSSSISTHPWEPCTQPLPTREEGVQALVHPLEEGVLGGEGLAGPRGECLSVWVEVGES